VAADLGETGGATGQASAAAGSSAAGAPGSSTTGPAGRTPLAASSPADGAAQIPSTPPPCRSVVAGQYRAGLGALLFTATLEFAGTPAVLYAYEVAGAHGGIDHRVLVLADSDCRLLTVLML